MIDEKDVEILDNFIEVILASRGSEVYMSTLEHLILTNSMSETELYYEYERIARIIHSYDAAKVFNLDTNIKPVFRINYNTSKFANGGFRKKRKAEKAKAIYKKLRILAFWITTVFAVAAGISSTYTFIKGLTKEEVVQQPKQNNLKQ